MRLRVTGAVLGLVIIGVISTVSGAFGASQHQAAHTKRVQARKATVATDVMSVVGAFRTPLSPTEVSAQAALAARFERFASGADANLPMVRADFALARPAPIAGTDLDAWIAPSGNLICTYAPIPNGPHDAYSAHCATLSDIAAGRATQVVTVSDTGGQVITVTPVLDGEASPSLIDANGGHSSIAAHSNLAAALVPTSSKLETGDESVDLAGLTRYVK